jgi:PII-like signaling protein
MKRSPGETLRIFIEEQDQWEGRPLQQVILERALAAGLSGATVFRGCLGYGSQSRIHHPKLFQSTEHLPLVVEIVDSPEAIQAFLPVVQDLVQEGMATVESVTLLTNDGPRP